MVPRRPARPAGDAVARGRGHDIVGSVASNWKFHHLGIPVRDLDRSREAYEALGTASFRQEFVIDSSRIEEYLVYGKTPDPVVRTRAIMGTVGPVGVELLQPVQDTRSTRSCWNALARVLAMSPTP